MHFRSVPLATKKVAKQTKNPKYRWYNISHLPTPFNVGYTHILGNILKGLDVFMREISKTFPTFLKCPNREHNLYPKKLPNEDFGLLRENGWLRG